MAASMAMPIAVRAMGRRWPTPLNRIMVCPAPRHNCTYTQSMPSRTPSATWHPVWLARRCRYGVTIRGKELPRKKVSPERQDRRPETELFLFGKAFEIPQRDERVGEPRDRRLGQSGALRELAIGESLRGVFENAQDEKTPHERADEAPVVVINSRNAVSQGASALEATDFDGAIARSPSKSIPAPPNVPDPGTDVHAIMK